MLLRHRTKVVLASHFLPWGSIRSGKREAKNQTARRVKWRRKYTIQTAKQARKLPSTVRNS